MAFRLLFLPALTLVLAGPSRAILSDNLTGNISLSGVQSETDTDKRSTLRQEFTGNWHRNFSEYLTFSTSLRYYKFSFDRNEQTGMFKKEWQPTARLIWSHPAATISAGGRRRAAEGTSPADRLTNETFDLSLRTRINRYPLLSVRYDWNHLYGEPGVAGRNIVDRRLDVGLDYQKGSLAGSYKFTRSDIDNLVSGLQTDQNRHMMRLAYTATALRDRRLRLAADYTFSYRTQTDRLPTTETLLHLIEATSGLYGDRESAELGQLQVVPSLIDGNTTEPVRPLIDIGSGMTNRHLGVDLGVARQITALYIYTNDISDEQLNWQVYVSEDNFTWEVYSLSPAIRFDASVLRYEIVFPTVFARYIKAINSGFNQAEQVLVTEIQAVTEVPSTGITSQRHSSHVANLGSTYKVNEQWTVTADMSYQREPSVGLRGSRDNLYHSGSLRFQQSARILQALRWQTSLQYAHGELADLRDHSLMYSFKYEPLPTLDLSWSATGRRSFAGGAPDSDDLRFIGQAVGTPLVGLKLSSQVSYGRDHRHALNRTSDTWNRSLTVDARATRSLETTASYTHQVSKTRETDERLLRDQYSVGFRLRLTRKISLRGNVDWSRGSSRYLSQEFGASWNLSTAISAGFLYRLSDDNGGYRSERYNARLNCRLSSRSSAYLSYTDNDFSQAAGSHTKSVQLGLRTGF